MSISNRGRRIMKRMIQAQGGKCYYCDKPVTQQKSGATAHQHNTATFDHIVPRCAGGSNKQHNLVVSCHQCNNAKGHTHFIEFIVMMAVSA